MSATYPDTAILIFARQPVPGKVKTRLIPALGIDNATRLYVQMLRQSINTAVNSHLADILLYISAESDPQYFLSNPLTSEIKLQIQQGNNLGEKMFNALEQTLIKYKRAVLIGTDCPFLNAGILHAAILALNTDKADRNTMVFSPSLDGGYVLVGASQVCRGVFKDIAWGTGLVMSQTRSALQKQQLQWRELKKLQDIDTGEDLSALSQVHGFQQWAGSLLLAGDKVSGAKHD